MNTQTFELDFEAGRSAYREEKKRTDNPHLTRAIAWDKGYVAAAREEYAKTKATTRIVGFREWICVQPE